MRLSKHFVQRWTWNRIHNHTQRRQWNPLNHEHPILLQRSITLRNAPCVYFHSTRHTLYDGKGQDLLEHSISASENMHHPKIILDSYYPNTGIDVIGLLDYNHHDNTTSENDRNESDTPKSIFMNSSIIAFPHACFLWKPTNIKEITLESLSMVPLCKPSIEYLFIGTDTPMPPRELNRIKKGMSKHHIVVDQLDVMNAMGTFNILNGEDRRVAVAILIQVDKDGLEK